MDQRSLLAAADANARARDAALASLSGPRLDPSASLLGAYPPGAPGSAPAPPFFEDRSIVLSRPAQLRDYQGDPAAYPMRTARPVEFSPYVPQPAPVAAEPAMLVPPSEAEQKWLHDRALAADAAAAAAANAARSRPDFSTPPAPFQSRLGFRAPSTPPAQSPPPREHFHQNVVTSEFFWGGTGHFVSENGRSHAQKYYATNRPLGGRAKTHSVTNTTPYGYHFSGPLSYEETHGQGR